MRARAEGLVVVCGWVVGEGVGGSFGAGDEEKGGRAEEEGWGWGAVAEWPFPSFE